MGATICKSCKIKKKSAFSGGSILDRVISQSSNEDQCLLYKLANYKKGGELIEAYNLGGQIEVEKLIKEQFGQLMYNDGKGQIINRSEYLRWKFRDCEQVVLPIEASLSPHDPLAKWEDHEACWQMQYRGSLGETLIHVLIICDTKIHTKIARTMIRCFPKLAMDVVEGEEYLGAGALHLAIAYSNNELVQDLIEAGADVNQRATGSFFLPRDQQRSKPAKNTDYEGLAYLGEYPLSWAACCANESVYNLLLDFDAHPDLQDSFGNMILHMVVVCDKLDMFGYALRHPKLPASNGILNTAGLTPLTLACKLGRAEVFNEMLELSAREFWRYSNITCSGYPLNALDTLLPDGRTNWNSALFIILNGTKQEHLDMLDGGIIQRLLEEKWKTFARNQFLKRLLILLVHLLFLSVAVYTRPDDPDESLLSPPDDPVVITRYVAEVGTVLGVLSYLVLQQGDEIKNQGLWTFLKQQSASPPKLIFLVANFLILACIYYRLKEDRNMEEALLLIAVPGSWFLLMFFAGAIKLTGPFVTMIYSMITGDMLTFGIIYSVFLFGFSQCFYFLYKGFPGVKNTLYSSYPSTWMALFQITLGNYDYAELSLTSYPGMAKAVFTLFMVFVPILLLNMLIAMMGNTYAHVIEQSEKEWMKQWAKIVISLERAIPQADAHHYLQEYSIGLGPSDDPKYEIRGVMVIKSKSKTRAKQRKGAVLNWRKVCKVTLTAMKRKKMTGEEMRCLMWGRESINTPIKKNTRPKGGDPLLDPLGPSITGAFEGALSATLEVISFAHDVNMVGGGGSVPGEGGVPGAGIVGVPGGPGVGGLLTGAIGGTVIGAGSVLGSVSTVGSTVGPVKPVGPPGSTPGNVLLPETNLGNLGNVLTVPGGKPSTPTVTPSIVSASGHLQVPGTPNTFVSNLKNLNSAITTPLTDLTTLNTQITSPQLVTQMIIGPQHQHNLQMQPKPQPQGQIQTISASIQSEDPMRDLIFMSMTTSEEKFLLSQLARQAANPVEDNLTNLIPSQGVTQASSSAKSLAGIFAGTEPFVKKVETVIKKKYTALDPSDSDGPGEAPLLGRVSRIKRAKSATQRKSAGKIRVSQQNKTDKTKLLSPSSDSSSIDTIVNDNDIKYQKKGCDNKAIELDDADLRLKDLKENIKNYHNIRPINIDLAVREVKEVKDGGDNLQNVKTDVVTVEGAGAGVDNQDTPGQVNKKVHKVKRPRTAKHNRVSPAVDVGARACQSAVKVSDTTQSVEDDPDPLEPWSTKDIANMNKILAWETDDNM